MNAVRMTPGIFDGRAFETVRYPDDEIMLRVTSAGNVQVVEYRSEDRTGPPPHLHAWDEVEYVIEGHVEFFLNESWIPAGPGSVQTLPAGIPHSVRVPDGSARLLMITIGAPFDGFSRELGVLFSKGSPSLEDLVQVAARQSVHLAQAHP